MSGAGIDDLPDDSAQQPPQTLMARDAA